MNKKFLSAILFGALMVSSTGTFVSCKDYDDDIDNLQEQINKLATKEDMTSQIATLQAALDAAKTEAAAAKASAEQAVAKANSAESTATEAEKAAAQAALDAANAKAEAIKAAQDEVAKVKAELEAAIDSKFEAEKEALAKTISELTETVTKLTGLTTDMITSIDLQTAEGFTTQLDLNYYQIADNKTWGGKTSYTFGKDMEGSFTVSAGEIFANPASLLVSVAPANAALPAEILSIVDSEGTSINDYINLTSSSYTDKLYKGARAASNGLYTVTAELKKDADKKAFAKLLDDGKTTSDKKYVAFAVAATKENRTVTSTYDVMIQSTTDSITKAIEIDTRSTIKSSIAEEGTLKKWNGYNGGKPETTATPNNEYCYPVVDGEAFTIKVASKADAVATETATSKVLASYVVVDIDNGALSTTDKAAIKSLTITGDVNKVSKENVFNIAIGGTYSKGVVVPLKVVTIDYTGEETTNVVWVKAGGSSEVAQTVSYIITPNAKVADPITYAYEQIQKFTIPAGYASYELSIVDKEDGINFNGNLLSFYEDAKGDKASNDPAKVAYAKFATTVNLQALKDNKVYEGTVKFFDKEGTFLSQSVVKVQKVLPTVLPEGFSIKTNQLDAQGVYNCYLVPNSWTADKTTPNTNTGTMAMSHVFNYGKAAAADYEITFAGAKKDKNKDVDNTVTGDKSLTVANSYIDNKTQHTTTVVYNYGAISSEKKDGKFIDYTVDAASFPTVFNCIYNYVTPTYSWRWATLADLDLKATDKLPYKTTLTYGTNSYGATVPTADVFAKYIKGVSSRDGQYSAFLSAPYENSLKIKEAHLVSNGNKEVDEYFNVEITADGNDIKGFTATSVSNETNPTAAVASTLKVTVYDMYGHEYVIELPMTVNPR
ncbi:hypothetical protein GAY80_11265 [Phocaeicola vulgatus]|uniref:Cell surface protein n=2 Tax=Phocaeicola vulgatus TaxID=821 RepID=A0A7J5RHB3_PHOVU|nr:hypothetical protein GAY80_11265 [Phocaeicola vulgatus]KAB6560119.1 hypothetical protein GAY79_11510 [Phocaeicola vulgatus]KAB6565016.1 hypothetical protein GAY82_11505 [Phocaeicola vulgatus]KAB6569505.1 hypothetical protein GAY81_10970 [Phocaeicola vulgatus]KAB6577953.1 hypothetical protein GAY84_11120 [Phocaeicola vulgatus]